MLTRSKLFSAGLLAFVLLFTAGCAKPKPAGLTDDQVTAVATNILTAMDAGNAASFSQDMSDQMSAYFTAAKFNDLQTMLQKASGKFVSLGQPALTNNAGYAIYRFPAKYDLETVYVTITFQVGGSKVEGLFFDSTNLREQPK